MKNLKIIDDNTIEIDGEKYKKEELKRDILFRTEDGVDMYVGNKYYSINANLQENIQELFATKDTIKSCFYRYFSTKESAKKYIILNKPCLSINDFKNILKMPGFEIIKPLEELVKSKLNQ